MVRIAVTAIFHKGEPLAIRDGAGRESVGTKRYTMARSFVVKGKAAVRMSNFINALAERNPANGTGSC